MGRWMTQDPIGFAAGDTNLSRYVGNSPTDRVDPSGLAWTVLRQGLDRAVAKAGANTDTVADLARDIKLDANEYRKWLKGHFGTRLPATENAGSLAGCTFTVPNTI